MTNTNRPIRRALVSVFHKEGIEVLAEAFVKAGTEVVSTGSTAKKLAELGVKVPRCPMSPDTPNASTAASRRCTRTFTPAFWLI